MFMYLFIFTFYPHLRTCLLTLERREEREETSMWERNIDRLPPICTLMGLNWTHNLSNVQGDTPTNWATWLGLDHLKKFLMYWFLERERGRKGGREGGRDRETERQTETSICTLSASLVASCERPDLGGNLRPRRVGTTLWPTELPGQSWILF